MSHPATGEDPAQVLHTCAVAFSALAKSPCSLCTCRFIKSKRCPFVALTARWCVWKVQPLRSKTDMDRKERPASKCCKSFEGAHAISSAAPSSPKPS